jgi:hypothetical protein
MAPVLAELRSLLDTLNLLTPDEARPAAAHPHRPGAEAGSGGGAPSAVRWSVQGDHSGGLAFAGAAGARAGWRAADDRMPPSARADDDDDSASAGRSASGARLSFSAGGRAGSAAVARYEPRYRLDEQRSAGRGMRGAAELERDDEQRTCDRRGVHEVTLPCQWGDSGAERLRGKGGWKARGEGGSGGWGGVGCPVADWDARSGMRGALLGALTRAMRRGATGCVAAIR